MYCHRPRKKGITDCHLVSARLHCRGTVREAAIDPSKVVTGGQVGLKHGINE